MADVLDMRQQRQRLAASRGFAMWARRFPASYDHTTSVADLSDTVLRALMEGGDDASLLLHELIMGVMKLGKGVHFDSLESPVKLEVIDKALFLLDQLRFEVMRRLNWVRPSSFAAVPMVELIENFTTTYASMKNHTPQLLEHHPRYSEYQKLFEADRAVFIRRLVPDALEAFAEEPEGA